MKKPWFVMPRHLADDFATDWDPHPESAHPASDSGVAPSAASHRLALSHHFPGQTVAVAAGAPTVRANDTCYPFRPDTVFTWLTGETSPDAVLVMVPEGRGHASTLFLRQSSRAGSRDYFADWQHGALTVGAHPVLDTAQRALGLPVRDLADLPVGLLDAEGRVRAQSGVAAVDLVHRVADDLRLLKDDWEVEQLQRACDATARGFRDVAAVLPGLVAADLPRAERWIEGTFHRRARLEGNDVGYASIVAAGHHATTLHYTRNRGRLGADDLLLMDMGVELDSMYTADVTRTLPVGGRWSPGQAKVYRAVLEAQEAALAEVRTGAAFTAPHAAAMWVMADHLHHWGILPVTADVSLNTDIEAPGAGLHRRYTLHRVSHMLGLDVHDCAQARDELYPDGPLQVGMVLTVEPGLYFQTNDRRVPDDLRGIGVRLEDDVVVSRAGHRQLSADLPRTPAEVLAWMADAAADAATTAPFPDGPTRGGVRDG